jgi:2-iminobutanoate/2-iminopropanoate deaminase
MTVTSPDAHRLKSFGDSVNVSQREDLFAITGVTGVDPVTGTLPSSADEQFRQAFSNLRAVADLAGVQLDEVGRITVFTPDPANRPLINPPWLDLFPDATSRPARKTTHFPLADGVHVELEAVGVRGARRVAVEIEGVRHKDPLPMGARLGRYVFSSVIVPDVPGGGEVERVAAIEQCYRNMASFMEAAGGSLDDVSSVWTYMGMWDLHPEMVDIWVDAFPDEASRPSRKTLYYPRTSIQMQCEAVLGGSRSVLEIPGISHHDPIPMGAVTAGVFTTSGVDGRNPATNIEPRGVAAQSQQTLDNLFVLLEEAGGSPDALQHVTVLLGERHYLPEFLPAWRRAFPEPESAPALQAMTLGLPARDMLVQVIARGFVDPAPEWREGA